MENKDVENDNEMFPIIFNFMDTDGNKVFVTLSEFKSFAIHQNGYGILRLSGDGLFLVAKEDIDRVQAKIGWFESISYNRHLKPLTKSND